mgnify:CR=1 FL=1
MSSEEQGIEGVGWAVDEYAEVDLNDKRLERRCQGLAETLGKQPAASINCACEDWADSKAAYRFVSNEKVSREKLLEPHIKRTVERMKNHAMVLAIQDTTFLNFTGHSKTRDLGVIGPKKQNQRGFGLHSTLVVTPQGQPLGLLTQMMVERAVDEPDQELAEERPPLVAGTPRRPDKHQRVSGCVKGKGCFGRQEAAGGFASLRNFGREWGDEFRDDQADREGQHSADEMKYGDQSRFDVHFESP